MPDSEDIPQSPESFLFKGNEVTTVPFNTDLLIHTYKEQFLPTTLEEDGIVFYTENKTPDNETRAYRYIASMSADGKDPNQNFYAVSSIGVWSESFSEEDYRKIAETGMNLKSQMADEANKYLSNKRTVNLKNGSIVRVEYIPYSLKNSDRIINDIGSKQRKD